MTACKFAIDKNDGKQVSFHPYNPNSFWYKLWYDNMTNLGYQIV